MRPTLIALARSFCARIQDKTYPISSMPEWKFTIKARAFPGPAVENDLPNQLRTDHLTTNQTADYSPSVSAF
jgi:hypothetical protein